MPSLSASVNSSFLSYAYERGYIHDCTNLSALDALMHKESISMYIGFDCTAPSLHIGHLLPLMLLRAAQKHGHQPIILLGGGTTKIGDPTGKNKMRKILSEAEIASNVINISKIINSFLNFNSKSYPIVINNNEWLSDIKYMDFLRDYGVHFSVNKMLKFESIRPRIENEQNLSFLEFSYMLLQAYDFIELNRRFKCRLQFGGSDQWGNIISGIDLAKKLECDELFGLTLPLLTNSDGSKMGKTVKGAIWLDSKLLSTYDYWQYFRNVDDNMVFKLLNILTDLSTSEINDLSKNSNINYAKEILADNVTSICHGKDKAQSANRTAKGIFSSNNDDVNNILNKTDSSLIIEANSNDTLSIVDALKKIGFATTNSEAKRLIQAGNIVINNIALNNINYKFYSHDAKDGIFIIKVTKKKCFFVRFR